MKLSLTATFAALLAATSVISAPVIDDLDLDSPNLVRPKDGYALEARNPAGGAAEKEAYSNYNFVSAHDGGQDGFHAFEAVWDLSKHEKDPDFETLTKDIGGSHFGLLVGQTKNRVFTGYTYHMVFKSPLPTVGKYEGHPVKVMSNELNPSKAPPFKISKRYGTPRITSKTEIDKLAAGIINAHRAKYSLKTFHCKTFETELWAKVNPVK